MEPEAREPVHLLGVRFRALDARSARPVLRDRRSADVADALGLDLDRPRIPRSVVLVHAVRTAIFDRLVRDFVRRHPDAVVVDLGCGLDPRLLRCAPPATVDWYDVDLPPVVALRERLLPSRARLVGADVTGTGWLERLPRSRPALIVTDGLHALLTQEQFTALVTAVSAHFGGGELAFNAHSRLAMRNGRRVRGALRLPIRGTGVDDPREPLEWGAGLRLLDELSAAQAPEVAAFPPVLRATARLSARSARLRRHGDRVLRYRF